MTTFKKKRGLWKKIKKDLKRFRKRTLKIK